MVSSREIIETSKFRGLTADELRSKIEEAMSMGKLTLMKQVNHSSNLGKTPPLVLAEMLIFAQYIGTLEQED